MNKNKIIEEKESQILEFKKSLAERDEILETISAFANTSGGNICIGIEENKDGTIKNIAGIKIKGKEIENLTNEIKQNTDPVIFPSIEIKRLGDKNVLIITVKENQIKPVFANGKVYKRVGRSNLKLTTQEIRNLTKDDVGYSFTELTCEECKLEDIDEGKVRRFLRKAIAERNFNVDPEAPLSESLQRLKLMNGNKLTNAAVLLFGKNPQKYFLSAEVRCARFKGTEPIEFIDMKVFGGNVIDQRDDAVEFVKEHIKLHAKIVGVERVETWEYPIEAVREAITNAICHRKYDISSNVQVRIFDDRIEVWGCGSLPKPLTIDDLKKKHDSLLRNPLIGKCFFLIKYIEQWGTGTNRIIKECLSHGLPEPIFEEITGNLVVTLRKYKITEEIMKKLSPEKKKIVSYIKEQGKILRRECVKLLNVSPVTAFRYFKSLEKENIIERKGKGKNIFYVLK